MILDRGNFQVARAEQFWKKNSGDSSSESNLISYTRLSLVWFFIVQFLRRHPIVAGGMTALPEYEACFSAKAK